MISGDYNKKFVAVIVPVYNEAGQIGEVLDRILAIRGENLWEVIVVDDGSTDGTAEVLSKYAGRIRVATHHSNFGYGAALKTGIHHTRAENVIFIDADGQHDPEYIPEIVEQLRKHEFVIGMRRRQEGVPAIRLPGKLVLRLVVSFLVGKRIHDVNYGFRGGRRKLYLRMLDLLPDGFSFSTTSLVYALKSRFAITYLEIPSNTRKGVSTVKMFRDGFGTLLLALRLIMLFDPLRAFSLPAMAFVGLGILYQLYIFITIRITIVGGSILLILAGVILFHFGLLADQIASLRKEFSAQTGMLEDRIDENNEDK